MTRSGKTLFDRIGSVKNSLENAEQSFKDNQDMRGELDLMLAEAELKNLRRKKDVLWTWNRHVLAIGIASMVVFGGLIGWCFAMDQYQGATANPAPIGSSQNITKEKSSNDKSSTLETKVSGQRIKINPAEDEKPSQTVNISKNDMRRLVQSARVELYNSK